MTRLVLAAAAVAVAALVSPASASADCPHHFDERGTGVVNPLTDREITYCQPLWPVL